MYANVRIKKLTKVYLLPDITVFFQQHHNSVLHILKAKEGLKEIKKRTSQTCDAPGTMDLPDIMDIGYCKSIAASGM